MSTHSGNLVDTLYATVDNVIELCRRQRNAEQRLAEAIANEIAIEELMQREPWSLLADARVHLTNRVMSDGDVDAWFDLGELQDCLMNNLTDICLHCGEMEGLHRLEAKYCRNQHRFRGDGVLSYTFTKKG